jgi:hypothetical protein
MRKFIMAVVAAAAFAVAVPAAPVDAHEGAWQYNVLAPAGTWGQYSYWLCREQSSKKINELRYYGHLVSIQWICKKVFGTHWQTLLYYRHPY